MALVQLGGAQTWCVLQLAPEAQSVFRVQAFPTTVQVPVMQLLPRLQSAEREHWGSLAQAWPMQLPPGPQSESWEHSSPMAPEQLHAGSAAEARQRKSKRISPRSR
jgi:hypothetical protein